ncbi:hypothetical protein BgiMline_018632, partial [Biomphalaria glabrata]
MRNSSILESLVKTTTFRQMKILQRLGVSGTPQHPRQCRQHSKLCHLLTCHCLLMTLIAQSWSNIEGYFEEPLVSL